jgi:hypothetical protein
MMGTLTGKQPLRNRLQGKRLAALPEILAFDLI